VHDFLAKCITELKALQIATPYQIKPNFGVEYGLIRRFKLAIKYSLLNRLELGVNIKALELWGGYPPYLHPISQ
jgi:hypothetical protein